MARPIQKSKKEIKRGKRERRLVAECEEKGYIGACSWPVRKTWQGRAKYRIAFIERCGFNTTNMEKLGIPRNYRYMDVTGKTKKEVEDKLEEVKRHMMKTVVMMLTAVEDEGRTDYYDGYDEGWHRDDLYSDWSEEEDEQNEEEEKYEEDEQYGRYQKGVKRRSKRIKQKELAKELANKQKKEEDAKKWDEELMRDWNDKLVIE